MAHSAAEMMIAESPAQEAAEPPIEAVPRIGRGALGYQEPRPGLDGLAMAGMCGSCQSFVPEVNFGGAVTGARCVLFGSQMVVHDDDSCDRWLPFNAGLPCEALINFNAGELRKGLPQAVNPYSVGFRHEETTQCQNCRFVDLGELGAQRPPNIAECEAFESLNERSPNLFDLVTAINLRGGCNLWTAPPEPEPYPAPAVPMAIRGRT
jgi:hypothetical protein